MNVNVNVTKIEDVWVSIHVSVDLFRFFRGAALFLTFTMEYFIASIDLHLVKTIS